MRARRRGQDAVQASSAIIPVEAEGRTWDETHADGGATRQAPLDGPALGAADIDGRLGVEIERGVDVGMTTERPKPDAPVRPGVLWIAGTAVSSLIGGARSAPLAAPARPPGAAAFPGRASRLARTAWPVLAVSPAAPRASHACRAGLVA